MKSRIFDIDLAYGPALTVVAPPPLSAAAIPVVTAPLSTDTAPNAGPSSALPPGTTYTPGGEVRVNTVTASHQRSSFMGGNSAAMADGGYIIVWGHYIATGNEPMRMQRFDAVGNKVGGEVTVSTYTSNKTSATIATLNDGSFVVAWSSWNSQDGNGRGIFLQRFNAEGARLGVETQVNTQTTGDQDVPFITALSDGGFVITWDDFDSNLNGVMGQRFNAGGTKVGAEFLVNTTTTGTQHQASSIALADGGFAVVWRSLAPSNSGFMMQRFDANGTKLGNEVVVNTTPGNAWFSGSTVLSNGDILVTWSTYNAAGIFSQRFSSSGERIGGETRVDTRAADRLSGVVTEALDDGGYVVVWMAHGLDGRNPTTWGLFMQQFDADGVAIGKQTRVNITTTSNQYYATITVLNNGSFVVAWNSEGDQDGSGIGMYHRVYYVNKVIEDDAPGGHTITGGYGSDRIYGLDGNDVLSGGPNPGADTLYGGLGDDTFNIFNSDDKVVELAGEGTDTVRSSVDFSLVGRYVEVLTLTGTAISATGNSYGNVLNGNASNNVLDGGSGEDTMAGGAGNDTYYVQTRDDVIIETAGNGSDTVFTSVTWSMEGSDLEILNLLGDGNISATGNALNNYFGDNTGINTFTGGLGDDTYYLQNAEDRSIEKAGEGRDTIITSASRSLAGTLVEDLVLTDDLSIDGTGNSLGNKIVGNDGANVLNGMGGKDTLTGGGYTDTFLFTLASGQDVITDFSGTQGDSINIHAYTNGVATPSLVTQSGADVVITLGGGNLVTVNNSTVGDVLNHMVW